MKSCKKCNTVKEDNEFRKYRNICIECNRIYAKEHYHIKQSELKESVVFYIIYKTTNIINNKYYIGMHKTTNLDDGYIGSGIYSDAGAKSYKNNYFLYNKKSAFVNAVCKYGYENFKKEILFVYDNKEECVNKEIELVNENVVNDSKSYNIGLGGIGGGNKSTTDSMEKTIIQLWEDGTRKDCISSVFNISYSVIYRITKGLKRSTSKTKINYNADGWMKSNDCNFYTDMYINRKMTKDEINKEIPFDLYSLDFLKNVKQVPKYVAFIEQEPFMFSTSDEIRKKTNKIIHLSGIRECCKRKYPHYKNIKFMYYKDYKN